MPSLRVAAPGSLGALFALACAAWGAPARAAEVTVSGVAACADAATIAEQASDLLGRPLASVPGVDFAVGFSRLATGRWQLRLDTLEREKGSEPAGERARRTREIQAARCEELSEAAAVGIAMSVRELSPDVAQPAAAPSPAPNPTPAAPPVAATTPARPAIPATALSLAPRAAILGDVGSLPAPTAGLDLGVVLRGRRFRVGLSAFTYLSREAHVTGAIGGEVHLLGGAVDACAVAGASGPRWLACGGFELGRLSAQGVGISRPRLGTAWWEAVRADVGVAFTAHEHLTLTARGGVVVPLSRPEFVIDGMTSVFTPSRVGARLSLGGELEF